MIAPGPLEALLQEHFDPEWGAAFWLERRNALSFDPLREIHSLEDLAQFGPMPMEALAARPVYDFLPRRYHAARHTCVAAETGGTTGPPKRTLYLPGEFQAAFVTPFLAAAEVLHFPRDCDWLYIGPSGPHIIGKAARACANAMGSVDPFTVDFDPRWVRRLVAGSMSRERYLEHVLQQAEAVLAVENIGVLFTTPPVVAALAERMDARRRAQIAGVHLGGMAPEPELWRRLHEEWFPNACILSGYGNSLAGVALQLESKPREMPVYFPHGERLFFETRAASPGGRGQVVFHRLDRSCLLLNVCERDEALAVDDTRWTGFGFQRVGLSDPRPLRATADPGVGGLY